jgi:hypothetical protein
MTAGMLHDSPHPVVAYLVLYGIVYGLLPLIFPSARESLWHRRRPIRKRPMSEEQVLEGKDLTRLMEHRPRQSLSHRILTKLRH